MRQKKRKREKVTNASEQSRIFAAAYLEIKPPAHVRMEKYHLPFFASVISEFAKADWTDHTIEIAALLARSLGEMEREQVLLIKEGSVSKSDKGTPVVNPRKAVVQMYAGTVLALRRSLSLHARAQGVNKADMGRRADASKAIEEMALDVDDELIARPRRLN